MYQTPSPTWLHAGPVRPWKGGHRRKNHRPGKRAHVWYACFQLAQPHGDPPTQPLKEALSCPKDGGNCLSKFQAQGYPIETCFPGAPWATRHGVGSMQTWSHVAGAPCARRPSSHGVPWPQGHTWQRSHFSQTDGSALQVSGSPWCQWPKREGASRRGRPADAEVGTLTWAQSTPATRMLTTPKFLFSFSVKVLDWKPRGISGSSFP